MKTVLAMKIYLLVVLISFGHSDCYSKNWNRNKFNDDTLHVFQNDTNLFKKEEIIITRPCRKTELSIRYKLIKPRKNTYYFIYNNPKQLIKERKYTLEFPYENAKKKSEDFYTSKTYFYSIKGVLSVIHFMKDGRNYKTEHFDRKKRLIKIRYFDPKSSDLRKIEIYKKGKLKETRIYERWNKFRIVKENQ